MLFVWQFVMPLMLPVSKLLKLLSLAGQSDKQNKDVVLFPLDRAGGEEGACGISL